MSISAATAFAHALALLKLPADGFAAELLNCANDVQSRISGFHNWHWLLTAGTNIAVVAGTQDYTMAAGDQEKVAAIGTANLLSGSTELPPLLVWAYPMLPKWTTQARPYTIGVISPTQLRFFPVPDATYTGKWTYYARPAVFTLSAQTYQCPDAFDNVILAGNIWKLYQAMDDDRAVAQEQDFMLQLNELRSREFRTAGRSR